MVSSAVRAPLRSITALVASVVPWMTMAMSAGAQRRRLPGSSRTPAITPCSGAAGVVRTLMVVRRAVVLERQVGEGAADIDGEAGTLHQVLALLSYVRTSPTTRTRTRSEFPGR